MKYHMMTDLGSLEYHLLTRFHKFDKDIKPSKNESFIILPLEGAESLYCHLYSYRIKTEKKRAESMKI